MKRAADVQSSLTNMVTNSTVYSAVSHEIEFEIRREVPQKNKVGYVLLAMLLGGLGFDRCFMGQCCLGVIKAMTAGGFGIWAMCDYVLAAHNGLTKQKEINSLGYHATFEQGSVQSGYYAAAVVLGIQFGPMLCLMLLYLSLILITTIAGRCCMGSVVNMAASTQAAMEEKGANARDASAAALPFGFASTFRSFNLLPEKPSEAECKSLFKTMDKDGNKKLSKDELSAALSCLGVSAEHIDKMIKAADKNNDGEIDESEFLCAARQ